MATAGYYAMKYNHNEPRKITEETQEKTIEVIGTVSTFEMRYALVT